MSLITTVAVVGVVTYIVTEAAISVLSSIAIIILNMTYVKVRKKVRRIRRRYTEWKQMRKEFKLGKKRDKM